MTRTGEYAESWAQEGTLLEWLFLLTQCQGSLDEEAKNQIVDRLLQIANFSHWDVSHLKLQKKIAAIFTSSIERNQRETLAKAEKAGTVLTYLNMYATAVEVDRKEVILAVENFCGQEDRKEWKGQYVGQEINTWEEISLEEMALYRYLSTLREKLNQFNAQSSHASYPAELPEILAMVRQMAYRATDIAFAEYLNVYALQVEIDWNLNKHDEICGNPPKGPVGPYLKAWSQVSEPASKEMKEWLRAQWPEFYELWSELLSDIDKCRTKMNAAQMRGEKWSEQFDEEHYLRQISIHRRILLQKEQLVQVYQSLYHKKLGARPPEVFARYFDDTAPEEIEKAVSKVVSKPPKQGKKKTVPPILEAKVIEEPPTENAIPYDQRVTRWFNDPKGTIQSEADYANLSPVLQREQMSRHDFSEKFDEFIGTKYSKAIPQGDRMLYVIPVEREAATGQREFGTVEYAFGSDGLCFHRFFKTRTAEEMKAFCINGQWDRIEFPSLKDIALVQGEKRERLSTQDIKRAIGFTLLNMMEIVDQEYGMSYRFLPVSS